MTLKPLKIDFSEWGAILTSLTVFVITLSSLSNASWYTKTLTYQICFLFLSYFICLLFVMNENFNRRHSTARLYIFILQLLSAFAINLLFSSEFLSILTIIWASILPSFVSNKAAILITSFVVFIWFYINWILGAGDNLIFSAFLFYTFHLFAVSMTINAMSAERAKAKAEELNKELQSTQSLLSEVSRQNERTRIARDLHDLLGHHLTALLINLQVAERTTKGEAKQNIQQCHSLAKLLMSDVREAVSSIRENQTLDFNLMLEQMVEAIPKLNFDIQINYQFELDEIEMAKQLLSCIQESITNSLKHSGADRFSLSINKVDDRSTSSELEVKLSDNGYVSPPIKIGHGLKGIQERAEALKGKAEFSTDNGHMYTTIMIPLN